ncbi:tail fiber protein [Niabella sp. CC-SYL272]|uniref:phage tail protein n=1 Tax=Niabella agricola TaxID=2891571 RepID=UPI001F2D3DB3|nr:tail fiber protein [Niabella agricola]MCF3111450.1 tail fiber protein [Niabella agricola]
MEPLLGFIAMFGFNFAPRGWAFCQGQTMSIAQNQALFALLGTYYGGNGVNTFNLPDLRGRVPIHSGMSNYGPSYNLGQMGGSESTQLRINHLPSHTHEISAVSETGDTELPTGAYLANTGPLNYGYKASGTKTQMNAGMMGSSGNNEPVSNMQPFLVLNFCIALNGVFPSRN